MRFERPIERLRGILRRGLCCGLLLARAPAAASGTVMPTAAPLIVTNLDDSGPGSLRDAMAQANAAGGGSYTVQGTAPTSSQVAASSRT